MAFVTGIVPVVHAVAVTAVGRGVFSARFVERGDAGGFAAGFYQRAMLLFGCEQVVEVQGVFGVHIATHIALAAVGARRLAGAIAVALLLADGQGHALLRRIAFAEEHTNVRRAAGSAIGFGKVGIQGGALDGAPWVVRGWWHRACAQHALADAVVRGECCCVQLGRPPGLEHPGRRGHEHIGINQGATAQACADHRVHAVVVADVKQAIELAGTAGLGLRPEVMGKVMRAAGKTAFGVALAALQQHHLARPACSESAACNRTAEAATDNNRFQKAFLCHAPP